MNKLEKTTFSLYILTFVLGAFGGFGVVPELFVQALFGLVAVLMIGCLWRLRIGD